MKLNKDYSKLEGDAKQAQAIADIVSYLDSFQLFIEITNAARVDGKHFPNGRLTLKSFRFTIGFAGLQGYPVHAWYGLMYGNDALEEELAKDAAKEEELT